MSTTEWIIWITIIGIGVGGAVVKFVELLLYKHKVRLIDLSQQNGLELDFKARDYNKDGIIYWQLNKERNKELKNMPVPPAGAINLAKRGKKSVTVIRTETGEYIFLRREINLSRIPELKNIPQEILNVKEEQKRKELIKRYKELILRRFKAKNKGIILEGTYQPFTSKQRLLIVSNYEKTKARKGFNLKEHIPQMIAYGMMAMVIIALMIFWGDMAQPALNSKQLTKQIVEAQKEHAEILREIKLGIQAIEAEQGGG